MGTAPSLDRQASRSVYMDANASTPIVPEVFEAMTPWLMRRCGNASSTHAYGRQARTAVENARQQRGGFLETLHALSFFMQGRAATFVVPVLHSKINTPNREAMHICYLDDSGDPTVRAFSVLSVPVLEWHTCFKNVKSYRKHLKGKCGIYVRKELHATEFVGGRGKIAPHSISKEGRVRIFNHALLAITHLPGVKLFSAIAAKRDEYMLFERLLNRINRTMQAWDSHALLISDEGKDYNRLVRKMGVYNPIPSQFGGPPRNITLDRIIDEILYKRSQDSHFIQMADFCAYALLRSEVHLPSKNALGLNRSFDRLHPLCQVQCYKDDPRRLGIIRV